MYDVKIEHKLAKYCIETDLDESTIFSRHECSEPEIELQEFILS